MSSAGAPFTHELGGGGAESHRGRRSCSQCRDMGSSGNLSVSSQRGAEGAADRKQQPVWVNVVIKMLVSSAKRVHVIDHYQEAAA